MEVHDDPGARQLEGRTHEAEDHRVVHVHERALVRRQAREHAKARRDLTPAAGAQAGEIVLAARDAVGIERVTCGAVARDPGGAVEAALSGGG